MWRVVLTQVHHGDWQVSLGLGGCGENGPVGRVVGVRIWPLGQILTLAWGQVALMWAIWIGASDFAGEIQAP